VRWPATDTACIVFVHEARKGEKPPHHQQLHVAGVAV